jgi:predicted glycosyltransferase/glycosyltransferase involved in cell wall biosynthesis
MPVPPSGPARVLVYSHDTYGLGHVRRSLLLAGSLAALAQVGAVLVATGSPRAQSFRLPPGVDTLKLPAATKEPAGAYRTRSLGVDFDDLVEVRGQLLDAAARSFRPDLVLVDHAPVGMAGELWPLLRRLAGQSTRPRLVLGLRDVVDHADRVRAEWDRLDAWPALDRLYDRVLVYGDPAVPTTAMEIDLDRRLHGRVRHVGYLARTSVSSEPSTDGLPVIVVTVGGGGDGLPVLDAYADFLEAHGGDRRFRSVVLTGPLLSGRRRVAVAERLRRTGADVEVHEFVADPERLFARAAGVVSMAGYNTTCELLACGVPTMLVPREAPRVEQLLRARRLADTGAVSVARVDELPSRLGPFVDSALSARQRGVPTVALDGVARATAELAELLPTPPSASARTELGSPAPDLRVGYVLKKFPRLSETFVLNELLALEAAGVDVSVMSTRAPDDEPRHAALDRLQAPVMQLTRHRSAQLGDLLAELRRRAHPGAAATAERFLARLPEPARAQVLGQALQVADQVGHRALQHLRAHFLTVAAHTAYVAHLVCGVPFSVTAHAKDIYRHTVDRDVFAEVAAAATALVTVCEANRHHIVEHLLGERPARVEVVYNGLPVDELGGRGGVRERDLVLAVGRLVEKKGFDVLVEACRVLRDEGQPVRCLIVGDGDQRDALAERIRARGLSAHVQLTGPLPSERLFELMQVAGALAVPCVTGADGNRDALPTVVLEAMAWGLPVVATPVGGIGEMVSDGVEGRLVDERDPVGLAAALSDVLGDAAAWEAMSEAGRRTVVERFDRRVAAARLVEIVSGTGPRAVAAAQVAPIEVAVR